MLTIAKFSIKDLCLVAKISVLDVYRDPGYAPSVMSKDCTKEERNVNSKLTLSWYKDLLSSTKQSFKTFNSFSTFSWLKVIFLLDNKT